MNHTEYMRIWSKKNKDKIKKTAHESYIRHRQARINKAKNWREANRDKNNATRRVHRRISEDYFNTRVAIGDRAELFALKILENSIWITKTNRKEHFDLMWNNKRIDVKSSKIAKDGAWHFATEKKYHTEKDYYFCIGYRNGLPNKCFLIPVQKFPKWGSSIFPGKSKYNDFLYWSFK